MQFFFPIIAVLSFGPALALLYFSLSKYTWPRAEKPYFDDRWIFGLLALGIIAGGLLVYIDDFLFGGPADFLITMMVVIVQQLFILIVLNYPRLRRKGAGRFYGYSLGTAVAAGMALGQFGVKLGGSSTIDLQALLILLVYTFGMEILGGAAGSIIGYSIEEARISRGVASAVSLEIIFSFLLVPVFSFRPSLLTMGFDLAAMALAVVVYLVVVYRILPSSLIAPGGSVRKRLM